MVVRKPRILFLASYFPKPDNPQMGIWALKQAQALVRQEIDLQVLSFTSWVPQGLARTAGAKAYAECPIQHTWDDGVKVYYPRWLYYPVPPIKQVTYRFPGLLLQAAKSTSISALSRFIEQFKPDLIFCHHCLPNAWIAAHLPVHQRKPLVTLDHDFDEISDCKRFPLRQKAIQFVIDHSVLTLAVSQRMANSFNEIFRNPTIRVQHNGVDPIPLNLFQTPRPPAVKDKIIILCCALFAERKGIPGLIEAFSLISPQYPQAILRIIGTGPDEVPIKQTIKKLNLTDKVQLAGPKPHTEVLQEMVWSDCFALVGWDEPFATVYLEAMSAEKPIICCSDGGINDIIQDSEHGFVVAPKNIPETANALRRMLSNPQKRRFMGKKARHLIESTQTWDIQTQKMLGLLSDYMPN